MWSSHLRTSDIFFMALYSPHLWSHKTSQQCGVVYAHTNGERELLIRMYSLSCIQHKTLKMHMKHGAYPYWSLFDIVISFRDPYLIQSKSVGLRQPQTYREVNFLWGMIIRTLRTWYIPRTRPWSHQTFRPVLVVKLLGIMLRNKCWSITFHIIIARDADGWY